MRLGPGKVRENVECACPVEDALEPMKGSARSDKEEGDVQDNGAAAAGANDDNPAPIQNLPRDWQDAFGIRGGGSYFINPMIEVFGGLGYDSNAIPDESLDPALTDFHDISVAVGGRLTFGKHVAVAASWTQLFYISRDTTGLKKNAEYQQPSRGPDAGASTRGSRLAATQRRACLRLDLPPT